MSGTLQASHFSWSSQRKEVKLTRAGRLDWEESMPATTQGIHWHPQPGLLPEVTVGVDNPKPC